MQVHIQPSGQETTVQLIGELDTMATTEQADELQQVLNIADQAAFQAQKDSPNGKKTMKSYLWSLEKVAYDQAHS